MCVPGKTRKPSGQEQRVTLALRWLPVILLAVHMSIDAFDPMLNAVMGLAIRSGFLLTPMAEAKVAASGFLIWATFYAVLDLLPGLQPLRFDGFSKESAPLHITLCLWFAVCMTSSLSENCGAISLALAFVTVLIAIGAGTISEIRRSPWIAWCVLKLYGIAFTYMAAIGTLHLFKEPAPSDLGPITTSRFCIEVFFGIFSYDFVFFFVHLALHQSWGLKWLHGHGQHHNTLMPSGRLCPLDTVNHHFVDGSLQVLTNIFVQNLNPLSGPKHKLSKFAHNALVTYLLMESHSGYDAPWAAHRVYPWIFGGAQRHHLHHKEGSPYLQQFFTYLDDYRNKRAAGAISRHVKSR